MFLAWKPSELWVKVADPLVPSAVPVGPGVSEALLNTMTVFEASGSEPYKVIGAPVARLGTTTGPR